MRCLALLGLVAWGLGSWAGPSGGASPQPCPASCSCDGDRGVDCSGRGLAAVPPGLSAFTHALDISMNNITRLPEDAFKNFPYLEELRLAGNDLSFIHPKALSGLKELKVLTLQNNQLKTVPNEAIRGLSGLQSLRLDANHITAIPEDSFEGLVQLRHLWLDDNSLTEVPIYPLSNLPSLQALTLALNKITHIPDYAFTNLSSLVVLHLHNNKIKTIGKHCFDGLDNLETLDLNYNNMVEFPEAIKALPSLKELGFHSNYISIIPDGAFAGNPLLRTIHLYDNPLSFVGNSAFQNLSDLHSLVIRGASMVQWFPNLTGTVNLESLTLTGTKINSIPVNLCQEQKVLRALDLSYNNIKDLPSFKGCHSLEEISLQHNQIHEITEDTFQGLSSLRILDLSRNRIHHIHKEAFATVGAIVNLDLSFNELTSVPTEGLNGLNQLKLAGNSELKEALAAKNFAKLRSLSVPYAYQCCAFWGCDSYLNSNAEDSSHQDQGALMDREKADADVLRNEENEELGQTIIHCTPATGTMMIFLQAAKTVVSMRRKAEDSEIAVREKESPLKDNLSPWEEWFIGKEKELRARLQARAVEEMNIQLEKMKQKQECERRKRIAEEKHKEWVQKKREEERRERERKLSKEMSEKATKELEKMQLQEKAELKYKEWLKKKRTEEAEKKRKEKEKEKEREAELQEKKTRSEKIFKEWLHNARNKPRPVLNGYGFPRGKSTGCADGSLYPAPAYCNPIPWKPVHVPPPKEDNVLSMKKSKRPVSCRSHVSLVIYKPKNNPCIGSLCRKQL